MCVLVTLQADVPKAYALINVELCAGLTVTGLRVLVSNLVFWANSEDTALRSSTFAALLQCCGPLAERVGQDGKGEAAAVFDQIIMGIIMATMRRSLQFGSEVVRSEWLLLLASLAKLFPLHPRYAIRSRTSPSYQL